MISSVSLPLLVGSIVNAHGGVLTGHWEFDLAIAMVFFAVVAYSFLLPADAPTGAGRVVIQGIAVLFFLGALVMAVVGFRSL
jgi:hypothetical protein